MNVGQRRIGSWGLEVGSVGLGCMSMTGVYDVEQRQDERSEQTVRRAIDLGVTFVDTADSYGPFTNELLIGRALGARRDAAVLATKVGLVGRSDGAVLRNGKPEHIAAACEASLRRLRTDRIDLYSLHSIDPDVPVEESWDAMATLVAAGKVRALGIMTDDIATVARLQAYFPVTAVFCEYSLWAQRNEPLVRWCGDRGIGVLSTSPLGRGYLTGTVGPGRKFSWTDLRSRLGQFSPEALRDNRVWVERLRSVGRTRNASPAQVALAWVLGRGERIVPVAGTKRPDHLKENAQAADLVLGEEDLRQLAGELEPEESIAPTR